MLTSSIKMGFEERPNEGGQCLEITSQDNMEDLPVFPFVNFNAIGRSAPKLAIVYVTPSIHICCVITFRPD